MSSESSGWRTGLGIVLVVISVVRLMYTCSDMNRRNNTVSNNSEFSPYIMTQEKTEALAEQNRINTQIEQFKKNRISNNLFYKDYSALDSLTALEYEDYGVYRIKKDTLIFIDIKTQLNVPKEYFLQNNHDDSLRVAIKSPRNLTVFIHDFETKESIENSFKSLKKYSNLKKFKIENTLGGAKTMSYQISKENRKYNGYAIVFQNKGRDYQTFFEFESTTLSPDLLQSKAFEFLLENMKQKK